MTPSDTNPAAQEETPIETPPAATEPTKTEEKEAEAKKEGDKQSVFGSGSQISESVFSMFGGGSKLKREEKNDEEAEPKEKKDGDVCSLRVYSLALMQFY